LSLAPDGIAQSHQKVQMGELIRLAVMRGDVVQAGAAAFVAERPLLCGQVPG
jgi:hypothetical protein